MNTATKLPLQGDNKKVLIWLLLVYAAGVAIRLLIARFASQNPFVMPDEALYANIARSIADGSGVMLRNQPVTYTNVLYPLLLSPVYAFAGAGEQFRIIQIVNCFFMNLAIFPVYGIAKNFTKDSRMAFLIAVFSLLLPDLLLTTRIMTEPIEYPLFLCTVYLMFGKISGNREGFKQAALAAASAFLLTQAKSGMIALALLFIGFLAVDCIRTRSKKEILYAAVFAGVFAGLMLLCNLLLHGSGMDFTHQTIYETQTKAPTLDHLKTTLPGLLLYAFFVPVAFGIFPLLLPASQLRRYDPAQRKQVLLTLLALAVIAAGACYMFFDSETVGNYFAGRIHIRYVFMFLPLLLCFSWSPGMEGAKPNGRMLLYMGFLLAMTVTVSFGALLSGRQYPVDAILLSYIVYDDKVFNWRLFSQVAAITFGVGMLGLVYRKGWIKEVKRVFLVCMAVVLVVTNILGCDLNSYNNQKSMADDAGQGARMIAGEPAVIVGDNGIYFDNTLTVLDCAMTRAPYAILFEDLCANLGSYGALESVQPPQYWTENPANKITGVSYAVFNASAFSKFVPAEGAQVKYTQNGYYGIVHLPENKRIFHSAIAGLKPDGQTGNNTVLYIYDEKLLSQNKIRIYLQVSNGSFGKLQLTANGTSYDVVLEANSEWIYADFNMPAGSTAFKMTIQSLSGSPVIKTYRVE